MNEPAFGGVATRPGQPLAVVGIGVCAASLRSVETLFSTRQVGLDAAYLISIRPQEGLDVDAVVDALKGSSLQVKIAADGEPLAPGHVYVGGPDEMITIADGHVRVQAETEPVGSRGAFDSMLISLAEHAHERAIAVILAGLGSDGAAGVTATKKFGGLSIAELAAGEVGDQRNGSGPVPVVDLHLPVERISAEIRRYVDSLALAAEGAEKEEIAEDIAAHIGKITTILRNVTGHDFHGYKRGTFIRRVQRRMQVMQINGFEAYLARLRTDRNEVQNLFQDLLIGVTQFFRDPAEFDALEREIPRLFKRKAAGEPFRVWVLGCATGEEAYSIAILLREHMATLDQTPEVQIFATDLDARALGLARAGRYAEDAIASHVRPDRLARWFVRKGATYSVSKELREMCIFSPHNVVKDAPFSRIDILSCRNLLIYLNTDLQSRVIPIFHFSLKTGGVLFLGTSENVTRHQKLFAPLDRKNRVFRRLETATRVIPNFPLTPRQAGERSPAFAATASGASAPSQLTASVGRQAQAVAERYAPAYVVVDLQGDVLHFSGRTGRYIEPTAGAATLNLVNLVHHDLRIDLRAMLRQALSEGRRIELPRVLKHEDRHYGVNLIVEPVGKDEITSLVVLFQDAGLVPESTDAEGDQLATNEQVQRLEAELRVTRDRLQATIEELESTNEELKSSNEEYQSINEEMQSASEEMETSKEELQSINEELHTVNSELAHRVAELGHTNSDLKNLLESTQIATVFLDNDLRVRNFTPAATDIFHLLEIDLGRPLDHVVSRVAYPELAEDARHVLKTLAPVEREVTGTVTDRHFAARVLPYRSVDNYISGVVVTFTDLTAVHQTQAALRESEERLRQFGEASRDVLWIRNAETFQWEYLTPAFEPIYGLDRASALSGDNMAGWAELIVLEDRERAVESIRRVRDGEWMTFEYRIRRPLDGQIRWLRNTDFPIRDEAGRVMRIGGIGHDITELKEIEEALAAVERRQRALIEGIPQLVWRSCDQGLWTWASPQWLAFTGQSQEDSHGWGWLDVVHHDSHAATRRAWENARPTGLLDVEYRVRRTDGAWVWHHTRSVPVRDAEGRIVEWLGTSTDIDDLRNLQERQKVLVAELQHRTRNLIGVIRAVSDKTGRASVDFADFRTRFSNRLDALARVQGLLSRLSEHDRVTFDELIRTELSAMNGSAERVTLKGPSDVRLRSSMVQTLAMALHELATNAVKYGALGQPHGELAVTWKLERDETAKEPLLHIDWRESGVQMPPAGSRPTGGGQGRELIERALPYQLSAKTSYTLGADGAHCTITIPVSASTAGQEAENG